MTWLPFREIGLLFSHTSCHTASLTLYLLHNHTLKYAAQDRSRVVISTSLSLFYPIFHVRFLTPRGCPIFYPSYSQMGNFYWRRGSNSCFCSQLAPLMLLTEDTHRRESTAIQVYSLIGFDSAKVQLLNIN